MLEDAKIYFNDGILSVKNCLSIAIESSSADDSRFPITSMHGQNEPLDVKEAYQTLALDVNREINRIRQNSPQHEPVDNRKCLDAILDNSESESSWDQELYGESALD
ncbi:16787_t:CDS:2, partial [Funneliformis geosporum]